MSTNQAPSQTVDTADYVLSKPPISDSKKPPRALSVLCRYFSEIVQPLAEMKDRVSGICKIRLSNISSQQPNISFLKCLALFKDFEKEIMHILRTANTPLNESLSYQGIYFTIPLYCTIWSCPL